LQRGEQIKREQSAKGTLLSGGTIKKLIRALLETLEASAHKLIEAHIKAGIQDPIEIANQVEAILSPISNAYFVSHSAMDSGRFGRYFDAQWPRVKHFFLSLKDLATVQMAHSQVSITTPTNNAAQIETPSDQEDRQFSVLAIEEASRSIFEDDRPHPKVGAVVTRDGRALSKAFRGEKPKCHAEYVALEEKLHDEIVAGATVYTTLEPCTTRSHPKIPCADRLVERRVRRVVIGMLDPNPDISGKGLQRLREAGVEVKLFDTDLMARCEELNREFVRAQKGKGKNDRKTPAD